LCLNATEPITKYRLPVVQSRRMRYHEHVAVRGCRLGSSDLAASVLAHLGRLLFLMASGFENNTQYTFRQYLFYIGMQQAVTMRKVAL
jgi:hypothetical protein